MGAPENIVTNASKIANTDYFPIDQVIFSDVWNTSVTNSVNTYTLTYGDTGVNQFGRPIGIYSYDGGVTYNELWTQNIPGGSLLTNSSSTARPSVAITPMMGDGTLKFNCVVYSTVGAGSTIPLIIKVALLAVDSPSTLPSVPTQSADNKQAYTTLSDGSQGSYRQILLTGVINSSSSAQPYSTVAHGAGKVPMPELWFYDGLNDITFENFWDYRYNLGTRSPGITGCAMDSTNLYIAYSYTAYSSGQTLYRVYREN